MRVCIVGLGGVGGYIAAYLAKAGVDVVGVARGEHLRKIQSDGITIIEDEQVFTEQIEALSIEQLQGVFDVVLFCVKSYDLQESARQLQPFIGSHTKVLSLANGVDNHTILASQLSAEVLSGCIYILAHIEEPGVIKKQGKVFAVVLQKEHSEEIVEIFEKSNLRYKLSLNIKEDIWKKYIFIAAFAMLTSYYDLSINEVYQQYPKETQQVLEEIALIASLDGIDLSREVEKSLDTASKLPKKASTSMHRDFKNKKKTELESLSGYLLNQARKFEVKLPLIEKIYKELAR